MDLPPNDPQLVAQGPFGDDRFFLFTNAQFPNRPSLILIVRLKETLAILPASEWQYGFHIGFM
jgi:hypothetical protein